MTKTITSVFLTALLTSALSVSAATTPENTDDGSALGTSDTPQIKHQDKRIEKSSTNKSMKRNNRMGNNSKQMKMEMKMMDTNNDGMVSHDEYMAHHEQMYTDMNPGDGGVSYRSSMNNKPMGTTTGKSMNGSVDLTKDGPINGTTTGTN